MPTPRQVLQHIIARLGGMEMAYEFFKLHPEIEEHSICFANLEPRLFEPKQLGEHFFQQWCMPFIKSDRIAARLANRSAWEQ